MKRSAVAILASLLLRASVLHAEEGPLVMIEEFADDRIGISPVTPGDYDKVVAPLGADAASLWRASFFVKNNTNHKIVAFRVLWTFWDSARKRRAVWVSTYDRLGYESFWSGFNIDVPDRLHHISYQMRDTGSRSGAP